MTKKSSSSLIGRREFVAGAAAGAVIAGFPHISRAATKTVKIGLIHPVTGFLAYPGGQLRYGCQMAIADINKAGGVKSMGGAKLEALLGDSQTKPQIGAAEVEKMNASWRRRLYWLLSKRRRSCRDSSGGQVQYSVLHRCRCLGSSGWTRLEKRFPYG